MKNKRLFWGKFIPFFGLLILGACPGYLAPNVLIDNGLCASQKTGQKQDLKQPSKQVEQRNKQQTPSLFFPPSSCSIWF